MDKNIKYIALFLVSLLLSSCLMHVIYGDEVRLQFVNRSSFKFKNLEIYSLSDEIEPIKIFVDEIYPSSKGQVETVNMIGEFNMRVLKADTTCVSDDCWEMWDLNKVKIEGGSSRFIVTGTKEETLAYEIK